MKIAMKKLFAVLLCGCLLAAGCAALAEGAAEPEFSLAGSAYGVTAAEEVRMGTALAQLAENAAAEGVTLRVQGMDELLAGAEYSAMENLRPAEAALLALKLLGHEEEIDNALAELEIELSDDANTLYGAVAERLSGMRDEDWTEYEGLLEQYFPVREENDAMFLRQYSRFSVNSNCDGRKISGARGQSQRGTANAATASAALPWQVAGKC